MSNKKALRSIDVCVTFACEDYSSYPITVTLPAGAVDVDMIQAIKGVVPVVYETANVQWQQAFNAEEVARAEQVVPV